MALGIEQYAGLIQRMRAYIINGIDPITRKGYRVISPFTNGETDFENTNSEYSWIDLFLRDDVTIFGFGLDYSEIDIWWIIMYKEKMKSLQKKNFGKTKYIYYYKNESDLKKNNDKLEMLRSIGVEVNDYKVNKYNDAFELFIKNYRANE
jgi:hypothetical protein